METTTTTTTTATPTATSTSIINNNKPSNSIQTNNCTSNNNDLSSLSFISSTSTNFNNSQDEELIKIELLEKENQEFKIKTRKLLLEVGEKNEIILMLKEELETIKEQNDKFQRENLRLMKDAQKVKYLQDEFDSLESKVENVGKLESEIKRLKDKLQESELLKTIIGNLEKERDKIQEDCNEAEDRCKKAESKLEEVSNLENELKKWKSFSHELESEKNSIQAKLLESIEQENKFISMNRQTEDEIKRLQSVIKSYEEKQDCTLINDENRNLKQKINEQQILNDGLRDELECNRKSISELRQDLACEKNLAQILSKQLKSFTKQIKDFNQTPIQSADSSVNEGSTLLSQADVSKPIDNREPELNNDNNQVENTKDLTKIKEEDEDSVYQQADYQQIVATKPSLIASEKPAKLLDGSQITPKPTAKPISSCQTRTEPATIDAAKSSLIIINDDAQPVIGRRLDSKNSNESEATSKQQQQQQHQLCSVEDNDLEVEYDNRTTNLTPEARVPTPVKTKSSPSSSKFVRNSQSSRSVNFGHSRSTAYLNKIHASVTATTTTKNTSATSFNGETTNSGIVSTHNQQPTHQQAQQEPQYVLNCALAHEHLAKCYVNRNLIAHLPVSHVIPNDQVSTTPSQLQPSRQLSALIDPVSHERLLLEMMHAHAQQDPAFYQQGKHQHNSKQLNNIATATTNLESTEQQIAHLTSLHQQHYYHHLQHMHQLHRMHHLHLNHHRMHHKYQQIQENMKATPINGCSSNQTANNQTGSEDSRCEHLNARRQRSYEPIYSGGSQFHVPSLQLATEQLYANTMNPNNNNISKTHEHNHQNNNKHHECTNLVSNSNHQHQQPVATYANSDNLRSSPNGRGAGTRFSPNKLSNHQYILPQIDEVNGLPCADIRSHNSNNRTSPMKQEVINTTAKSTQHNSNGLPSSSSSSPTSSTSPNLSPSSASSSSSLNSLSASSVPLNRGALRHTTTDATRRQFSVERDLLGTVPMTATLSRVGSCRANTVRSIEDSQMMLQSKLAYVEPQMRTPVKTQQPSMRTSKILNISQQQQQQQQSLANQGQLQLPIHQSAEHNESQQPQIRGLSAAKSSMERLASNLANIRLKDSLAFSSLRGHKKSSAANSVATSSVAFNGPADNDCRTSADQTSSKNTSRLKTAAPARVLAQSLTSSPERRRQIYMTATDKMVSIDRGGNRAANNQNNNISMDNKNKPSSMLFEYGCV